MSQKKYRVIYDLPDYLKGAYLKLGYNLENLNSHGKWQLPILGTFIIDQAGLVRYAFVNADYKVRMEPRGIMAIFNLMV